MLLDVCERAYESMEAALQILAEETMSSHERLIKALGIIRNSLHFLSDHLYKYPIASGEEAIIYCKSVLPKFYAWSIYHHEWYLMNTTRPCTTQKKMKAFWLDELRMLGRLTARYPLHHSYYKNCGTELDKLFFIKNADAGSLAPDIPEFDQIFPTTCGYLFAKFRAYEMLSIAVKNILDKSSGTVDIPLPKQRQARKMRWTGDSINLAELAYGIYETKQVNDGNATLSEIFEWMEESLHIRIGRPTRRFEEIERRKKISPTDFLDRMRWEIIARIDRKNVYDAEAEEEKRARKERRAKAAAKSRHKQDENSNNLNTGNQ
ncbi:RteC domain-containing protein [Mucilaginibacter sp. AW1-7]|uniref:RteC domain-containing protein n=1 Tax=Mucilaginibacter sp. AW1-7 TaxID=3349874 RepID=UPI003F73D533